LSKIACFIFFLFLVQFSFAQMTVGGTASSLGNDCYQLTAASNSQAGYVYQNASLNLNDPFDYKFQVYLGNNNGGADGIVFVLRDTLGSPYIGTGGGGIGFLNLSTSGSIGVEVDTWYNGGYNDITADHIGIHKNGGVNHSAATGLAGPIQASATSANVEDGNWHTLNIRWDPDAGDGEFEVYLDCDFRLQYQGDLIDSVFGGDANVFWGFVGSTGGANNIQRFCFSVPIDSLVTDMTDATICSGDSVQLQAGDSAVSYDWSPTSSLSTNGIPNPWASPTSTQTYVVEQSYECDTIFDTVTVNVIPASFTVTAEVDDALCFGDCNGAIDISVNGGSGLFEYEWSTADTTEDLTGLCVGNYTVSVQDVDTLSSTYLCVVVETFAVGEPNLLTATIVNASKTSCSDGTTCDANATAAASGGVLPYTYLWTSNETTETATGLCKDSNWVTVTDSNGCQVEASVFILVPDTIATKGFGDTLICITNPAGLAASSTGGTPPFDYVWTKHSLNGTVVSTNAIMTVFPDETTTYYVSSTDSNGCVGDTSKVTVKVRPPLGLIIPEVDTICPYDTISITVEGEGGDSTYTYAWETGVFGPTAIVSPDLPEYIAVTVTDACGTPAYVDSVFVQVGGYSPIDVKIRVEDDSLCQGETTHIIASGRGGFRGPEEYVFNWNHTNDKNPIQFVTPQKTKQYHVTITDLCLSKAGVATINVEVGRPYLPKMEAFPEEVCAATDATIVIDAYFPEYLYNFTVDGKDQFLNYRSDSMRLSFTEPGCHDIEARVVTDFGCIATKKYECLTKVLTQPEAMFDNEPANPTNVDPMVKFWDESKYAESVFWVFQYDTVWMDSVVHYEFYERQAGYTVKLIVVSEDGCTDTASKFLPYIKETLVYYPKSFTPNQDGLNDVFLIKGEGIATEGFQLTVFDRWGQQVFMSTNKANGWDGKFAGGGDYVPQGSYPFVLQYVDRYGQTKKIRDQIIISKSGDTRGLR